MLMDKNHPCYWGSEIPHARNTQYTLDQWVRGQNYKSILTFKINAIMVKVTCLS